MIAPSTFLYSLDGDTQVATLTLNRPDRLNALTFEVYEELRTFFGAIGSEPDVRAVVITGAGKAFCTGGDVRDIIGPLLERDLDGLRTFTHLTCDVVGAIRRCSRPVVAAINGVAAGAGAAIAAACDIRVAATSARIAFLFTKVGLAGADMGTAWMLPRLIGLGRATELLMTGEFISAEEAHRIGLYNRLVPDGEALSAARSLAEALARGPRLALEQTKVAIDAEERMELTAALDYEAELQAALMKEPEFREAHDAFMARRAPRFR
jgi:enoyl-CoA hydratase/carnithine racemase